MRMLKLGMNVDDVVRQTARLHPNVNPNTLRQVYMAAAEGKTNPKLLAQLKNQMSPEEYQRLEGALNTTAPRTGGNTGTPAGKPPETEQPQGQTTTPQPNATPKPPQRTPEPPNSPKLSRPANIKNHDENWRQLGVDPREIFRDISRKENFRTPEEFEQAFQKWQKSLGETAVPGKGKPGNFSFGNSDKGHGISSNVDEDGTLTFLIRSTNKARRAARGQQIGKSEETGADLFARMMLRHGNTAKRIKARWTNNNEFLRDNFDSFRSMTRELGDPNRAAWETFTGKMARLYGFNRARIVSDNGSEVTVIFER
jgi:hypothetical protein